MILIRVTDRRSLKSGKAALEQQLQNKEASPAGSAPAHGPAAEAR